MAAAMLATFAVPVSGAQAAPPAPAADAVLDEAAAERLARERGVRVEVTAARTEHTTLYANPDGSRRMVQASSVVRVRRGDTWVAPDPTMVVHPDGSVGPVATMLDARVSRGGGEPLATMRSNGATLAVSWPAPLPAPVLSGATATYAEVLPGVDLVLTATAESLAEVLVVKSREAARNPALRRVTFGARTTGATLRKDASGGFSAVDASGTAVIVSPEPAMWDSRGRAADRTQRASDGDKVAAMPTEVTPASISITPDASLLADPATVFPVYIDPTYTGIGSTNHPEWAMVDEYYPTTEYFKFAGEEGVGYQNFDGVSRKRQFHEYYIGSLNDKTILDAKFRIYETWAATCTATEVELWETSNTVSASTNWTTQPTWSKYAGSRTVSYGRPGCPTPDPTDVEFDIDSVIAAAVAANKTTETLGVRAGSETSSSYWKRFANHAELIVDYNTPPNQPTGLRGVNPAFACGTGTSKAYINDATPLVAADVTDPDGGNVRIEFDWGIVGGTRYTYTTGLRASGTEVQMTIPHTGSPAWVHGTTYSYRARGYDNIDHSVYSVRCEMYVDLVDPNEPQVTSSTFPKDGTVSDQGQLPQVGALGSFTFGPAGGDTDVDSYKYSIDSDTAGTPAPNPATLNATTSVSYQALSPGLHWIAVRTVDRAKRESGITRYYFKVKATAPDGIWRFDDPDRLADTNEGVKHPVTTIGTTWAQGRKHGFEPPGYTNTDYALSVDGTAGSADTGAKLLTKSTRFTASAWMRLDPSASRTGTYVAVSENGTTGSAFTMGFKNNQWFAAMAASETATPVTVAIPAVNADGWDSVVSGVGQPNGWVKLTAVYDGVSLVLQIDGGADPTFPNASVTAPARWTTASTFRIGAGVAGNTWHGQVDDVVAIPWNADQATINQL